jgi:hypothetical protein
LPAQTNGTLLNGPCLCSNSVRAGGDKSSKIDGKKMRGKKTGGRKPGSKNKATLAMEAAAAAALGGDADAAAAAALGGDADARALPTLTKILRYFLDRAEAEASRAGGGDAKVVCEMLREARTTAAQLAPFQAPTFRAVAVSTLASRDGEQEEPGSVVSTDDPHAAMRVYRRIVCGSRAR